MRLDAQHGVAVGGLCRRYSCDNGGEGQQWCKEGALQCKQNRVSTMMTPSSECLIPS